MDAHVTGGRTIARLLYGGRISRTFLPSSGAAGSVEPRILPRRARESGKVADRLLLVNVTAPIPLPVPARARARARAICFRGSTSIPIKRRE